MDYIRRGLRNVVSDPMGTANTLANLSVAVAGKTGTAEYGVKGQGQKHVWMLTFAPFNEPRYAAVIVLDNGESGGRSAAPRMHDLMTTVFELEKGADG